MGRRVEGDNKFSTVPEWVIDAPISATAVRLYCVLQRYANSDGVCFPSRSTLARRMHCSVRSIDRAVEELEQVKALVKTLTKSPDGDWANNTYCVITADPRRGVATKTTPPSDKKDTTGSAVFGSRGSDRNDTLTKAIDNQTHTNEDASTKVDAGKELAKRWWEKQAVKPIGKRAFFALQNVCKAALDAGYAPEAILHALDQHGGVPSVAQLDRMLKGRNQPQSKRAANEQTLVDLHAQARAKAFAAAKGELQ